LPKALELHILNKIIKARRGTLFFPDSFPFAGNPKAVAKALERLVLHEFTRTDCIVNDEWINFDIDTEEDLERMRMNKKSFNISGV
jgi:hypothetical protein